jgi:RND family efflux transporter MFP subunit
MMVFLLGVYLLILFLLVNFKVVPFNLFWKLSPLVVLLLLSIALFIPMTWGAPQGRAIVLRNAVAIVPNVSGEVVEVPVDANRPLKAGDVLFRIDAAPFEAQVNTLKAQLQFQELRLSQMQQLQRTGTGRSFDVEQHLAEVDQFKGQIAAAEWNLEKTVIRAPADGYMTNLALRKGARVTSLPLSPVMSFIDTSDTIIGVEIAQINARYIAPGQAVEVTFKFLPGRVYPGRVETVLQAIASGQTQVSGTAAAPKGIEASPFIVRIRLDDRELAERLPAGSVGDAAIFTDHVKVAHVIRRVLLRQIAILNYLNPY